MLLTTQKIKLRKSWLDQSLADVAGNCQQWAHHSVPPWCPQAVTHHSTGHIFSQVLLLWDLLPDHWVDFSVVSPAIFLQLIWSGGEFGQLTKAYTMYLQLSAIILHLPFGRTFYRTFAFPQPCSSWKPPSPTNTLGWLRSWSFSFPKEGSGRRRDCPPESGGGGFSHWENPKLRNFACS